MKTVQYSQFSSKTRLNKLSVGHRGLFWGGLILWALIMAWPTA